MREHLERLLLELAIAFRIGYYLATIIERGYVILTLRPDKLAAATIPVSTGWLLGDCMEASMSPTRSNSGWTTRSADAKGSERPRDVRPPNDMKPRSVNGANNSRPPSITGIMRSGFAGTLQPSRPGLQTGSYAPKTSKPSPNGPSGPIGMPITLTR